MNLISMQARFLCASVSLFALLPSAAHAESITNAQAAEMLNKLNQLEQEVSDLRLKLAVLQNTQADQSTALVAANEKLASQKQTEIKWKGAPEIKTDDGWSFKPRGRILYDFGTVSAPNAIVDPGLGFANEARRVRLGASGSMPGGFGYKLEVDFAGSSVVLTDAILTYKDDGLQFTVGQHNNFQGLEELSSSNDTSFIERSAFTDAFGFERQVGVSALYKTGPIMLQGGIFTDSIPALGNDGNDSIGFDARIVAMPKLGDAQAHLGASYHYKSLGDTIQTRRYRQRPLVHFTDTRFINTGNIAGAQSETSYGLEAALISGRFHAAGEAHWLKLNRTAGLMDSTFFGGSIEAGIFLTDDQRQYKDGVFKSIKVKNPVGKGGLGAWQFNVRYDYLDLVDAGIIGGTQNSYQASIIWTPIDYVRFMLNYGHLSYDNAAILSGTSGNYSVDVFGARAQISF